METLYRYFDAEGTLLYIGVTSRINRRMREHYESSAWFAKVTRCEFEQFPDRKSVLDAERNAILSENPLHNNHHKPRSRCRSTFDENPEPGVDAAFDAKGTWREKGSHHAVTVRLAEIAPMHDWNRLHEALGLPQYVVKRALENGEIGYIDIPNKVGTKFCRYISGWQALDWLESIGAKP